MGFSIPDSPQRSPSSSSRPSRGVDASTQSTADAASDASPNTVAANDEWAARPRPRRRNAIVPTLSIEVIGSPRSPIVCVTQDDRQAIARAREQQHAEELGMHDPMTSRKRDGEADDSDASSTRHHNVYDMP